MTGILIFVAVLVAAVLIGVLVARSRKEPGGRSGLDPADVPADDAPIADEPERPATPRDEPGRPPSTADQPERPGTPRDQPGRPGGSGTTGDYPGGRS